MKEKDIRATLDSLRETRANGSRTLRGRGDIDTAIKVFERYLATLELLRGA